MKGGSYYVAVVCLFLLSLTIPIVNSVSVWFLPLPFVIMGVREGRNSLIVMLIALLSLGVFMNVPVLLYVWICFSVGFFMGRVYREPHTSAVQVVLGGMVGGIVSCLGALYVGVTYLGFSQVLQERWQDAWNNAPQFASLGAEGPPPIETFIPILLLMVLTILVLLNLWGARKWLTYKGFPGKYLPRFHNWNLPKPFFICFLLFVILYLIVEGEVPVAVDRSIVSIVIIFNVLFIVQGTSFLAYVLQFLGKKRRWLVFIIPLMLVPIVSSAILLLGILDVGVGLKKRMKKSKE